MKVLDENGRGVISDVIAALEWAIANKNAYNIRVANLSVGAAVTESYWTDPLTLAAKRAVDAGIVVVAAAGNLGKNKLGQSQYGGITAPGNAPWVITVGAYSHEGTLRRNDDVMAAYSSRGPAAVDFEAKPDLVAPGTGVVSLSDPASLFYSTKSANLLDGTRPTVLQAVSEPERNEHGRTGRQRHDRADDAGESFADAEHGESDSAVHGAAVQGLQRAHAGRRVPERRRSREACQVLQDGEGGRSAAPPAGNGASRSTGAATVWLAASSAPKANAFELGTVWGAARDRDGDNIVWGTLRDGDNIVWGTFADMADNIVWGTFRTVTTSCGAPHSDNIVWGTDCGGADCDNIVWGTLRDDADNIVWGTLRDARQHRLGHAADDGDNIVWGTPSDADNIVWGTAVDRRRSGLEETVLFEDPNSAPANFNNTSFESLIGTTSCH